MRNESMEFDFDSKPYVKLKDELLPHGTPAIR